MIEHWIDALCNVWGTITDERFGLVKSYTLVQAGNDFPASIDPAKLSLQPIAITIAADDVPTYTLGTQEAFYTGTTQFHVCPDNSMGRMPELTLWFGKIKRAAAAHIKLGGLVHDFVVERIEGPIELQYGNEAVHWGFMVYWRVKERNLGMTIGQ